MKRKHTSVLSLSSVVAFSVSYSGAANGQPTPQQIASEASPSVVTVGALVGDELAALGSGFIVSDDGLIVTNLHVVEGAEAVRVMLDTEEIYDNVFVIAEDVRRDLIILQIPATGLPALRVGDDREAQIGDRVYAVGSPLGFEGTFSEGIVSAKRTTDGVAYIQVTAPISQGSSGGPLLNADGEVIGVATMSAEGGQNINLAVPVRYATGMISLSEGRITFAEFAERWSGVGDAIADNLVTDERIDPEVVYDLLDFETRAAFDELDAYVRQVALRLLSVTALAIDEGIETEGDANYGVIGSGQSEYVEDRLSRGDYMLVGACDNDCTDLDLGVYGPDGNIVAQDIELDALPAVDFRVTDRGAYKFQADMVSCSTESCVYGIQLYKVP